MRVGAINCYAVWIARPFGSHTCEQGRLSAAFGHGVGLMIVMLAGSINFQEPFWPCARWCQRIGCCEPRTS